MDGDRRECPIVPNFTIRLRFGEAEDEVLYVAPSHDNIQVFPDSRYNYLRYYDDQTREAKAIFLAHNVLADLVDGGIPVCKRESITEGEVEIYEHHLGKLAIRAANDPIEAEVQAATAHLDEELKYYLGE